MDGIQQNYNTLCWRAISEAIATGTPQYVIQAGNKQKVLNSENVVFDPKWVAEGTLVLLFVGFPFSDTKKLIEWGVLEPR